MHHCVQGKRSDDAHEHEQVHVRFGVRKLAVGAALHELRALRELGQKVHNHVGNTNAGACRQHSLRPRSAEQPRLGDRDAGERDQSGGSEMHVGKCDARGRRQRSWGTMRR